MAMCTVSLKEEVSFFQTYAQSSYRDIRLFNGNLAQGQTAQEGSTRYMTYMLWFGLLTRPIHM